MLNVIRWIYLWPKFHKPLINDITEKSAKIAGHTCRYIVDTFLVVAFFAMLFGSIVLLGHIFGIDMSTP